MRLAHKSLGYRSEPERQTRMMCFNNNIGFSYFSSPEFMLDQYLQSWLPLLRKLGGSSVIFQSDFSKAIPEDAIRYAQDNNLTPIIQFSSELPLARVFNDVVVLLDVYEKWGVKHIIFGNKPNCKLSWPLAGWHSDNLVDRFLDRFIPLANHSLRIGIKPILAPMKPGGDYWDTAFIEMVLTGLKRRRLDGILQSLILSCYGHTFSKPLSWGAGGPERWPISRPYMTPDDQEDQLGFHNYEWAQAVGQRVTGLQLPILIIDAGNPGFNYSSTEPGNLIKTLRKIYLACQSSQELSFDMDSKTSISADGSVFFCTFSLDTIAKALGKDFSHNTLRGIFHSSNEEEDRLFAKYSSRKIFEHYLLLPSHTSGVSDVVLSKVRPIIKHLKPTVGFSLDEAAYASKVSVFPDPLLFSDELLNQLRSAGCCVEVLPESGIEIATSVQRL